MAMNNKLTGLYKEAYSQIKAELSQNAEKSQATQEALQDIENMLLNASCENTPIKDLFPEGLTIFCASVRVSLPAIPVDAKYKRKRSRRIWEISILGVVVLLMTALSLWYFGLFAFLKNGMWALVYDQGNYACSELHLWRGRSQPFTLEIDLNDLDSNKGKILYSDESGSADEAGCRITVGEVGYHERGDRRQYWIMLYCYADYDLKHTTYYYPRLVPIGNEDNPVHSMNVADKIYTPLGLYGEGGGECDYQKIAFYLIESKTNDILENPLIALNFWILDGYRYTRTGWDR